MELVESTGKSPSGATNFASVTDNLLYPVWPRTVALSIVYVIPVNKDEHMLSMEHTLAPALLRQPGYKVITSKVIYDHKSPSTSSPPYPEQMN
jgi:hypothetical protein